MAAAKEKQKAASPQMVNGTYNSKNVSQEKEEQSESHVSKTPELFLHPKYEITKTTN